MSLGGDGSTLGGARSGARSSWPSGGGRGECDTWSCAQGSAWPGSGGDRGVSGRCQGREEGLRGGFSGCPGLGAPAWDSPGDESARHCGPCWLLHFGKPALPHPEPPGVSACPWGGCVLPSPWAAVVGGRSDAVQSLSTEPGGGRGAPGSLHMPRVKGGARAD